MVFAYFALPTPLLSVGARLGNRDTFPKLGAGFIQEVRGVFRVIYILRFGVYFSLSCRHFLALSPSRVAWL